MGGFRSPTPISMPKGWSEQHIRQENHSARELKKLLDTYFESDKDYRVLARADRWIVQTSRRLSATETAAINQPTSTSSSRSNPLDTSFQSPDGDEDPVQQFPKPKRQTTFGLIKSNTFKMLGIGQS